MQSQLDTYKSDGIVWYLLAVETPLLFLHKKIGDILRVCVNWESIMAELSPRTDTSTDGDTEDKALGVISSTN